MPTESTIDRREEEERREQLSRFLKKAFPAGEGGSFADLRRAIEKLERKKRD